VAVSKKKTSRGRNNEKKEIMTVSEFFALNFRLANDIRNEIKLTVVTYVLFSQRLGLPLIYAIVVTCKLMLYRILAVTSNRRLCARIGRKPFYMQIGFYLPCISVLYIQVSGVIHELILTVKLQWQSQPVLWPPLLTTQYF